MRIIAHLDMDAFFAAVEERDHPELKGLPIVVGADPAQGKGRGVVSTANYAARKYGIHSALPISTAWRLSEKARAQGQPGAVFLGVNYRRYGEVSERIMALVRRHSPLVEEAGIDEVYFDLSFAGSFEQAAEICRRLKKEIQEQEKLTASVGIGPNKLVAKIASDFRKPDGLTKVTPEEAENFLEPLPVRKIPGIGPKTEKRLAREGIRLVRDLKKFSPEELQIRFGKWGPELYERIRGRHEAPLQEEYEPKSVGEQETFGEDTRDLNFIFDRLWGMCGSVWNRMQAEDFKTFRTVVVTVRFADFDTHSRSHTLAAATGSPARLRFTAMKLLMPFLDRRENPRRKLLRLIGVRLEKLER
ncbi:MAG: DNA polymerase IV [Deltaproteobacteria bacterium]|nr:DNA polymerase IV [Deltaproteobacteria bacterium]MBI4795226.1 DNA polymerase IV [Deltaproteobacteria bacterium]